MKHTNKTPSIDALFHPRNAVLVGASDRPDHWSRRVWDNLHRFRYPGRVFPMNPNRREIWDTTCYPDFKALPEPPDHLVIFTPAETSIRILREGAAAGARTATFYAAGFGEGGDAAGLALGAQLRQALDDTGVTIVGPNCMGVACGPSGFCSIPDETLQELGSGPIAVAAQSGAICASINRALNELGLKVSYFASCGGQFDCKVSDFIDYFAVQPQLRVALCYIEGIPDAAHFLAAAGRARQNGKTVIAVKIGGSVSARAFALAHTGSLAGTSEVFEAFAREAGIVCLLSLEDAIEATEYLARSPLPRGGNIAVMTNSGALRNLITEAADRTGASLASLTQATQDGLRRALPQDDITNPLDTKRTIPTRQYIACLDALVDAPEVDIILAAEELPRDDGAERRVANLRALEDVSLRGAAAGKPVVIFTPFITSPTDYGRSVRAQIPHVPVMRDIDRTLRVMRALADAGTRKIGGAGPVFAPPSDQEPARTWRARADRLTAPTALDEVESKALLAAYGIPLPPEHLVYTALEAEAAARALGFPVVLKGVSAAIAHKSDAGLVLLDLEDAEAIRCGVATLKERIAALNAPFEGILVAQQVSGGTETVLGINRDPEMGPVVMFGLGGIWVELFKDVSFAPPALDRERAAAMIKETRARRLLEGFRGSKPGDIDALIDALANLGRLARDLGDSIEAIDINPFVVCEKGRGAFALDGLVVLRPVIACPGRIAT